MLDIDTCGGGKSYRPLPFVRLIISLWKVLWMYYVELYARVRRACMVEGMSVREASRVFGLHRDTVRKMLAYSAPPGYRHQDPPRRPKLGPFTGVIDAILEADRQVPRKQRHTAKRIFERLRDEHGFTGQYTIVKDYVSEGLRPRAAATDAGDVRPLVPCTGSHAPGHAQCDFGEAVAVIAGVERKVHYFVLDLPHSDGCLVKAYPAETTEAFLDGHVSAFAFLGGAPRAFCTTTPGWRWPGSWGTVVVSGPVPSPSCSPTTCSRTGSVALARAMTRGRWRGWSASPPQLPSTGASFQSFDALNAHLEERCLRRMDARLRGHDETIGQRMERDLEALLPLPATAYDACDKQASRVSSLSLVRYRTNDYSVPVAYGHREVLVRGYVAEVVISWGAEVIARHPRSYEKDDREGRLRLRPHPLPAPFGAEDGGPGPGRAPAGVGAA